MFDTFRSRTYGVDVSPPSPSFEQAETPEETTVVGTKGRIKLLSPAHCPTAIEVTTKIEGRGMSWHLDLQFSPVNLAQLERASRQ